MGGGLTFHRQPTAEQVAIVHRKTYAAQEKVVAHTEPATLSPPRGWMD